jgi:hypothetical protein
MTISVQNRKDPHDRNLRDLDEFVRFLGPYSEKYNRAQLEQLQRDMFILAEILLDLYLAKRLNGRPMPGKGPAVFDRPEPNV